MSNMKRKRSDYVCELTEEQKEALLAIAVQKDEPLELLMLKAIDEFIEREKKLWNEKV